MTESGKNEDRETRGETGSDDSVDRDVGMKRLVKTALDDDDPPRVDVLGGVQRRLRERSGGKFYGDRWSTSRQPPVVTYLVTTVLMLVVALVLYAIVSPLRGAARPVDGVPDPILILPPGPAPAPPGDRGGQSSKAP